MSVFIGTLLLCNIEKIFKTNYVVDILALSVYICTRKKSASAG